jgi:acyl-homoserine lactone acylase PvdQ
MGHASLLHKPYLPGHKKRYGVNGNSFICVVEFGKKIKAKSLLAGGESGDPASPHFFDQGEMYSRGNSKMYCSTGKMY